MNREQDVLFSLLRASIHGITPKLGNVSRQEWIAVYQLAEANAVVALTFEGVSSLLQQEMLPRDILLKWLALSEQKKAHNRLCLSVLGEVVKLLDANDIPYAVLKGLGVAKNYPDFVLRDGGDIDLLIPTGDARVDDLLIGMGGVVVSKPGERLGLMYRGVYLQIHHTATHTKKRNNYLKSIFAVEKVDIDGLEVYIPSPQYMITHLLAHIDVHFVFEGIGLRHITDLYYFFTKYDAFYDKEMLRRGIKKMGIEPVTRFIMWIMSEKYELPDRFIPLEPLVSPFSEAVLENTVKGGNFGENAAFKTDLDRNRNIFVYKVDATLMIIRRQRLLKKIGVKATVKVILRPIKNIFSFLKTKPLR